ncbi:MAG: peptidase M23 [Thiothrix sp.]|nr:MAG: peptidase M23 [Thiothrix sp.]
MKPPAQLFTFLSTVCEIRLISIILLLLASPSWGQSLENSSVTREIDRLKTQIDRQQQQSENLNDEVNQMEKKISDIDKTVYNNEQKIEALLNRLQTANKQKEKLDAEVETQRAALAQQLVAMYTAGDQSYLRLLLRQDNPSDISRTLRYFEYLNTHRSTKIAALNTSIEKVQSLTNQMEKDRLQLTSLEDTLTDQKKSLQTTIASRETALQRLNNEIRIKQDQVERLRVQEAKLQTKFDELAARAEVQTPATPEKPEPEPAVEPKPTKPSEPENTQVAQKIEKTPTQSVTSEFTSNKPFSNLKGRLPAPVTGQVLHAYGSQRNEKQNWQGMVIAAQGGSKVRAVAPGKIAYVGQMDGYGFLTIIEHDRNYMTLYAYNRANYRQVGEMVRAGDVIAAVGSSGGQEQDALYFEVRKGRSLQNPAQWLR